MERGAQNVTPPFALKNQNIRRVMGITGLILPWFLVAFDIITKYLSNIPIPREDWIRGSISSYFYSQGGGIFVGVHVFFGIMLINYKGYEPREGEKYDFDNLLTNFAGLNAILLGIVPTPDVYNNTIINWIHFIAAAFFLISLGVMSYDQFTNYPDHLLEQKGRRITAFKWAGRVMFFNVALIITYTISDAFFVDFPDKELFDLIFWFETFGVTAFAFSWLHKSIGDSSKWVTELPRFYGQLIILIVISTVLSFSFLWRASGDPVVAGIIILMALVPYTIIYLSRNHIIWYFYKIYIKIKEQIKKSDGSRDDNEES